MHHLLFGAAIASIVAVNWPKARIPALAVLLGCHLIILEIQPVVKHVGDSFLNGLLLCLLFGFSRKYLYLGVFCGIFWLSLAMNKLIGIGWGNEHSSGIASILANDKVTNQWLTGISNAFPQKLLEISSVCTPWLQLLLAIASLYGIFGKKPKIKWGLCIVLPALFLITLQTSFTVGLFPAKVLLASLAFLLLQPIKFELKPALELIPILFFGMILSWSAPYKMNLYGSGLSLKAFSNRSSNLPETTATDLEAIQLIRESPWICQRFVRHYTKSEYLLAPASREKYEQILEIIHEQ